MLWLETAPTMPHIQGLSSIQSRDSRPSTEKYLLDFCLFMNFNFIKSLTSLNISYIEDLWNQSP